MQIIGQTDIQHNIDSYIESRLHKPILMVGRQGCGKHLFVAYFAQKLGLEIEDITETISAESINGLLSSALPKVLVFDISKIAMVKKLNVMLKFLEEPSIHYLVLLAESHQQISLPTIENRCVVLNFKSYSKEELNQIAIINNLDTSCVQYCSVPGQLFQINKETLESMIKLGQRLMQGLKGVNFVKFLKVKNKFNLDNKSTNKINIQSFILYMTKLWLGRADEQDLKCCLVTSKYNGFMLDSRMNLDMLMSNYLLDLWGVYNQ